VSDGETRTQGRLVAGRYRLVRELGRGGMGTVWLAADELLGRAVAVKELRPAAGREGADLQNQQQRALQEARSAARIQHPGVITLYEVIPAAAADDPVYLIMELVEGLTLGELIARDGPLPAPQVASYGLQVLDALAAAHALGIVHRDVKPENIMITAGDRAKLSDFGIAHTIGDPRLTSSGVLGTQAYVAPELFDAAPITPAADLWSLGATLYHAAEGHGPFNRDSTVPQCGPFCSTSCPSHVVTPAWPPQSAGCCAATRVSGPRSSRPGPACARSSASSQRPRLRRTWWGPAPPRTRTPARIRAPARNRTRAPTHQCAILCLPCHRPRRCLRPRQRKTPAAA
jgi:serine/threonine protein kinase